MRIIPILMRSIALFVLGLAPAFAEVTPADLQVMARALGFLAKPLSGAVSVGIVYSPGNPQSAREAEAIRSMLAGGLKVGNLSLSPVMVPLADLGRTDVGLLLLTAGLNDEAKGVLAASQSHHIPCVTTDLSQVQKGICVMGVRSQPKIEILVNRATAAANGTAFSTVFRMLITEI